MRKSTKIRLAVAAVVAPVAAGVAIWTGPPSEASVSSFETRAQEEIPYVVAKYGMSAVLTEGYHVCEWEQRGTTGASDLNDLIETEMPMSRSAGIELQVLAENHLGC